ncbi:MAG: invasion associated locus B family protein [Silicimonas sp.]|jgi:invasion protein IalB|nr:invasion associated locus B family protein [Silicimonas sp.]
MRIWTSLAAILAALAMTVAAQAQTDGTASDATESAGGVEGAAGETPGLSMGVEEAGPGQPYIRDTFGDWELRCVRDGNDSEICQLYQLMSDGNGNSVAEFNIFPLPEGGEAVAGANIVTPLETLLTAPLRLAVDSGQGKRYPYSFCSQIGCFSRIGLTADEIASFRQGSAAKITIVPAAAPNETVELTLSLSGFTAGFNALVEIEKARTAAPASE